RLADPDGHRVQPAHGTEDQRRRGLRRRPRPARHPRRAQPRAARPPRRSGVVPGGPLHQPPARQRPAGDLRGYRAAQRARLVWHDSDKLIGMDEMPYNRFVERTNGINYRAESLRERGGDFPLSSKVHGDPATPLVRAYAGDPVRFNVADVRGEQIHGFMLDGHHWKFNPEEP